MKSETLTTRRGRAARILFANPTGKTSGAEFSLLALMTHLDSVRFEPLLLCPEAGRLSALCQQSGIPTLFLPSIPSPSGRARDAYRTLLPNVVAIRRFVLEEGIDLVHANSPRMAYHSGLAARAAGVPHVTHVRNIHHSPFASPLKACLLDAISDQIVAVSAATRDAIVQDAPFLEPKVRVVYNGVGPAPTFDAASLQALRAEFLPDAAAPLLLTVGQITRWKGQDEIIRALPMILDRFPRARLLVVGEPLWSQDHAYAEHLRALAEEVGVRAQVVFTGFRRDVPRLLAASDLLLHCPVEPDPLPRILLEAGAQGCAVVATAVGGIPEQVVEGQTGRLVPPGTPEAIACAVTELLADPPRLRRMHAAARQRTLAHFSIEQHVAQVEALYEALLPRPRRQEEKATS